MKQSPGLAKDDFRRQQLISATTRCISQYGLSGTTISRVTQEANLSNGIVNFYFDGKLNLLLGTLASLHEEFQSDLNRVMQTHSDPAACLTALIDFHFSSKHCDADKIAVWHAFSSDSAHRQAYMETYGKHEEEYLKTLIQLFGELCNRISLPASAAEPFARAFIGLIDGLWQDKLYLPDTFDADAARRQCHDFLTALMPGIFPGSVTTKPPVSNTTAPTETPERSDLLQPWTYMNEELLELEMQHIFREQWLLVGHVSEVSEPLQFLTLDALGERILILRGKDDVLRAFHNVCRHRGAKLLDRERGSCRHRITCPFHGWAFDSSGALVAVPAKRTFDDFDVKDHALVSVDLEVWQGFIFIRMQGDAPPISEQLKAVDHILAPYQLDKLQMEPESRYRVERPYNWKVIHDIDNEGYHVPVGHPSLQQLYGKDYIDEFVDGIPHSHGKLNDSASETWSVRNYLSLLPRFEHLPEDCQRTWQYIGIFPSMVLGLYPDSVEFYMTIPKSIDTTWYIGGTYHFPDDRREARAARYLTQRINRQTDEEDEDFVRWMQDGLQSSALPEQKLSSIESGVRQFHHAIQKIIPVTSLRNPPKAGEVRDINEQLRNAH
ncbi:MAG: SRPBCC family protein [Pseudomonadota bacterium]